MQGEVGKVQGEAKKAQSEGAKGWIQRQLDENMGRVESMQQGVRGDGVEVDDNMKPEYTFKFKGDMADRLAAADIDAAMADKPKKKKKKKAVEVDPGVEGGPDTRFFEVEVERPTGVEFATDLSLKYVYCMEVKDNSPAQLATTPIRKGDQLAGINGEECIGKPFAEVAKMLGSNPEKPLSFRMFRGSKAALLEAVGREDVVPTKARITAIEPDGKEGLVTEQAGANLRDALRRNGIEVYNVAQGRFTNCNGRNLCGTCVIDIMQGAQFTNSKSIDEEASLRKMPPSYRLSCCVNVYGDILVKTRPSTGKKLIEFS
ncbi:hypothetical protein T484DRAFT_1935189 [Baffinella frigidus]|nr:hypothetical protein T484DRAFT_1935189 [Cryptophyta sp. CCMP2293]